MHMFTYKYCHEIMKCSIQIKNNYKNNWFHAEKFKSKFLKNVWESLGTKRLKIKHNDMQEEFPTQVKNIFPRI